MKSILRTAAAVSALTLAALSAGAGPAQAGIVFESFPNYATAGDTNTMLCSSCTGYGAVFASFSLSSQETLDKAFVLVTGPANAMTISLFADGGDGLPARNGTGGILNPLIYQDYTAPTSVAAAPGNAGNGGNSLVEFSLANWQVGPGNYWIRFAGYSNLLPVYQTATPGHSRAVGTDFLLEGRNVTYNPANMTVAFSLNGVDTPTGAVPEPATWAMMLVGFGAAGYAIRRRRTAASLA
ncbi:PEPxxWA-CTERM sorting domain-containing protein [Phenylobacterium sp.]|uniref:PEPxxWA-CTERM sorting domain-containing protein n=1 Tax=Phenylobacterium sp. TaxID=1871053 RepID=UPI003D2AAA28